jgi:hypothetical protein
MPWVRVPHALEHLDKGEGAAVHDGHFRGIHLHDGIVDSHAPEGRQQVFHRGNAGTVGADGGGEGRIRHVVIIRLNPVTEGISLRINTILSFASAGRIVMETFRPECNPVLRQ